MLVKHPRVASLNNQQHCLPRRGLPFPDSDMRV